MNKDVVIDSVRYFHANGIIKNGHMQKCDARPLFTTFKNEKKLKKMNFYWLVMNYLRYNMVEKNGRSKEIIIFEQKLLKKILTDRGYQLQLPNVKSNTVRVDQATVVKPQYTSKQTMNANAPQKVLYNDKEFSRIVTELMREIAFPEVLYSSEDILVEIVGERKEENLILTLRPNEEFKFDLKITNISKSTQDILQVSQMDSANVVTMLEAPIQLQPQQYTTVNIKVLKDTSFSILPVLVQYRDAKTHIQKTFIKLLNFSAISEFFDDFRAQTPFQKTAKKVVKELAEEIVPSEHMPPATTFKGKRLKKYALPPDYITLINKKFVSFEGITPTLKAELKHILGLLKIKDRKHCLTVKNYSELLTLLLRLEEHQMSIDIRQYDSETNALVKLNSGNFELKVPGLAEHRPSIIQGDSVYVRDGDSKVKYEGRVIAIKDIVVQLNFNKKFQDVYVKNKKFNVSYSYNRYPLRVEHQAVELAKANGVAKFLFPNPSPEEAIAKPLTNLAIKWFSKTIVNNSEQKQAVQCILQNTHTQYPYLIFGPPGTGKTSTVVEAILQVWNLMKDSKILVCAPSNDAVNEITKRLVATIPTTDLLRYMSISCSPNSIPVEIRKYTNYKNEVFYYPALYDVLKFRIVTTTLVNASRLVNCGATESFNYIFIDECGHGTETETLIPLSALLADSGQVVLIGDPEQLGPITHSPIAKEYGFGTSMLERLMDNVDLYKKHDNAYNPRYVTKLINNYRSHPAILKLPSELFYDSELLAKGEDFIHSAAKWDYLKNGKFPVIFHNVVGKDAREGNSPSYFNVPEMEVVDMYLRQLLGVKFQGRIITGHDIGIISPYRRQVQKLQLMCAKRNFKNLKIGSVEQFQGQEKLIIIVSTVRSQPELLTFDYKFHLGFLSNPKRFNVAVTRAQALLIVVGNGSLLQLEPCFYRFIKYCTENNSFYGPKFNLNENPPSKFVPRPFNLQALNFDDKPEDDVNFSRGNM